LPLGWVLSLVGVRLGPERERPPWGKVFLKEKVEKKFFKIRYVFIILKKSAKKENHFHQ
jgi:hypothetical protein